MRLCGNRVPADLQLLAIIADDLNLLHWKLSDRNGTPPRSIYNELNGIEAPQAEDAVMGFDSAEEFNAARLAAQGGGPHGD